MSIVNGGFIMAKVLKDFGVEDVFCLVSGHQDALYPELDKLGIKMHDFRSEYSAALAAVGYAKTSGKLGVVLCAPGGGVLNVTNGVGMANTDCVPLLVIGGQNAIQDMDALSINVVGNGLMTQIDMMKPLTKWCCQVTHICRLADQLGWGIRHATQGRPGAVYVEVPAPFMWQETEEDEIRYLNANMPIEAPAPSQEAIDHIMEKLMNAKRPMVMVGAGASFCSESGKELLEFLEMMNIPVVTNHKSRGIIPTKHKLWGKSFATIASMTHKGYTPDVLLMLGARFGLFAGGSRGQFISKDSYIIQVDIQGEEFGRNRDPEYAVVADVKKTLNALIAACKVRKDLPDFTSWADLVAETSAASKAKTLKLLETETDAVNSGDLSVIVSQNVPEDYIYVVGGGEAASWPDACMDTSGPNRNLLHGYAGNIGEGTPHAIGAAFANPGLPVVLMTGDGDFGYTLMEIETMVANKLPIICIVNNNSSWGMCSHGQDLLFDYKQRFVSSFTQAIRYDKVGEALGAHGEFVTKRDEIKPALERALAAAAEGRPSIINVITDDYAMHPITRRNVSHKFGEKDEQGRVFVPWSQDLFI